MAFDFKLKIVIHVCLILLSNSLPTKQDRRYGLVRSRIKANLRTPDADGSPPSSVDKIGETIEEPENTESSEGDAKTQQEDAKPPEADAKTVKGNAESSEGDAKTLKEDAKLSDGKTVKGNAKSHVGGSKALKESAESSDENNEPEKENAQHSDQNSKSSEEDIVKGLQDSSEFLEGENCWVQFNVQEHFTIMDSLDEKYLTTRESYNNSITSNLNREMMSIFFEDEVKDPIDGISGIFDWYQSNIIIILQTDFGHDDHFDSLLAYQSNNRIPISLFKKKGAALRALHNTAGDDRIPAGLNLGGYTMLKLNESLLFFHRMKLRNHTVFYVNKLENNLKDMTLSVDLYMNDLHLVGAYERATIGEHPSILYHAPTFGELEVLIREVSYSMEGRLRLQNQRLVVEMINSKLILQNNSILITYSNSHQTKPILIPEKTIGTFLDRMTNDFDHWLKDFFNDYYIYHKLNLTNNNDFVTYESQRLREYNRFTTNAITLIRRKIFEYNLFQVVMPNFTIVSFPYVQINLTDGTIYGFETIYKKSMTTGKKKDNHRYVDVLVGFGTIKAEYSFVATVPHQGQLAGHLVYSTNNIAAKLRLNMTKVSNETEITLKFDSQFSPDSFVVEGPASQFLPNFRHLIETHAISIMSSAISYNINMLSSITKCTPLLRPADKLDAYTYNENGQVHKPDAGYEYAFAIFEKPVFVIGSNVNVGKIN